MTKQDTAKLVEQYLTLSEDQIYESMGAIVADFSPAVAKAYMEVWDKLVAATTVKATSRTPKGNPRADLGRLFWGSLLSELQGTICPDKDKYKAAANPTVLIPIVYAVLLQVLPVQWAGAISYLAAQSVALIWRAGIETFCKIQTA